MQPLYKTGIGVVRNLHARSFRTSENPRSCDIYKWHTLSNGIINKLVIRDDVLTLKMRRENVKI
jgi:hypothetical protein